MKLPEPLFAIINPMVGLLLRSPLHAFWSGSLLLMTFTGRKSGRRFTTPLRYVQDGKRVRCFSSSSSRWWRNLRGGAAVTLRLQGREQAFRARVVEGDPAELERWLRACLGRFPQDAAYHGIRLDEDGSLVAEDVRRAAREAIMVVAEPV